ncbi:hypothetical protein TNCV_660761 [Trichonephila clavipes]|nr:hypothetical protein TNCV_660761 [Trichonephila clavipes]
MELHSTNSGVKKHNAIEGLPGVHFQTELLSHTNKNSDVPKYLRQLALEVINGIPSDAVLIYTDGIKDESNRTEVVPSSRSFLSGILDATQTAQFSETFGLQTVESKLSCFDPTPPLPVQFLPKYFFPSFDFQAIVITGVGGRRKADELGCVIPL